MGLTSTVLEELGIVDATIPEPQAARIAILRQRAGKRAHPKAVGVSAGTARARVAGYSLPAFDVIRHCVVRRPPSHDGSRPVSDQAAQLC